MSLIPVLCRSIPFVAALLVFTAAAAAQPPGVMPDRIRGCATPVADRRTEVGCYTTAETPLGPLPAGQWFWHIQSYATRAEAAAARGPRSTVVEVQGRVWLYTDCRGGVGAGRRPAGGDSRPART